MHRYQIRYLNSQGTLMRILSTVSRRGLDLPYVYAQPNGGEHRLTLYIESSPKMIAQMCRDWRATVDVLEVSEPEEVDPKDVPEYDSAQTVSA